VTAGVVKPGVAELLARLDTLVFDVDGVLLDVRASIRSVNVLAVPAYLRTLPGWSAPDDLLSSHDIERFKQAGGFNDDWDLTCAVVLLFLWKGARENSRDATRLHPLSPAVAEYTNAIALRGGWLRAAEALVFEQTTPDQEKTIRAQYDKKWAGRIFQELWAGDLCPRVYGYAPTINPGPGAVRRDRPLLDVSLLPQGVTLAALTGRTLSEAQLALEMVGLDKRIPLPGSQGITRDDGFFKPEPFGMQTLLSRLDARVALYVGDALDDLRTVLAFRALPEAQHVTLLSAQVLTGTVGPDAPRLFADADILAPDVNAVLELLRAST